MEFLKRMVNHKTFGRGIITGFEGDLVVVKFGSVYRRFLYPESMGHILELLEDESLLQEQHGFVLDKDRSNQKQDNIAFKCNYCDGGKDDNGIGFAGVCSKENIRYNIKERKYKWCSDPECMCRKYYDGHIAYRNISDDFLPCQDSVILLDWSAYTKSGGKSVKQETKRAARHRQNLAVLTTRMPGDEEKDRIVFAIFIIGDYLADNDIQGGVFTSIEEFRLQLTREEARRIKFWNYHSNKEGAKDGIWGMGLHRNLTDGEAIVILRDIVRVKEGKKDERDAKKIYEYYCDTHKGSRLIADNAPV